MRICFRDLNKDARPDLVSIVRERFSDGIRSDGKIRIFYGSSDGTFKSFYDLPAHPVPAAAYANSLAGLVVQDVNSDGRSDVISVARDRMLVSVFLGTPSGELSTPSVIPLGAAPSSVHLSDLDADGRPDIIMTHPSDDTIGFLRAKGPGRFGPYSTLPVSGRPVLVCIADVNGDRIPDLITANSTAMDLAVFHGLEDGGLSLARRTPVGAPPVALACEDLDADGAADIVVSLESIGRIKILYGAYGPAGIGLPGSAEYEMAAVPESIALGDVNHDGRVDMVYSTGFTIGVWLGNGDRTFRNAGSSATGSMANSFIALADINEDRHLDAILLLDTWIDNVKIGLGRGDGSFQSFRSFSAGDSPLATVIADIDRDGRPDLVTANKRSGDITFLRNLSR